MSNRLTETPCRVCNKPYDGATHCSVVACTACAMFFKRSETWDFVPKCKFGANACKLDKARRITCSACRYHKCIEAGMKPKKNRRSLKCIQNLEAADCSAEDNKMTIELRELVVETMPMLKRFCYFYAQTSNNKKNNEYALLREDGAELIELPGNRLAGRITQSLTNRMMDHDLAEFYKLMNGTFPAFTTMERGSQGTLIYLLMFPLFELTASFRSLRVFNDVNCRTILCTDVLFADLDNISSFADPTMFANDMDYKAIKSYIRVWWGKYFNSTLRIMHRIKITDVEFLAVCALTIWDEANFFDSPQLSRMAEKHRSLIYKDLDYYYRNILHLDNYVERVMNFKELGEVIKKNYETLSESFYFLRTFNYYKSSEGLWDVASKVIEAIERVGTN